VLIELLAQMDGFDGMRVATGASSRARTSTKGIAPSPRSFSAAAPVTTSSASAAESTSLSHSATLISNTVTAASLLACCLLLHLNFGFTPSVSQVNFQSKEFSC
jgi:hypothetical protein